MFWIYIFLLFQIKYKQKQIVEIILKILKKIYIDIILT